MTGKFLLNSQTDAAESLQARDKRPGVSHRR
jgi:hypothetical protein